MSTNLFSNQPLEIIEKILTDDEFIANESTENQKEYLAILVKWEDDLTKSGRKLKSENTKAKNKILDVLPEEEVKQMQIELGEITITGKTNSTQVIKLNVTKDKLKDIVIQTGYKPLVAFTLRELKKAVVDPDCPREVLDCIEETFEDQLGFEITETPMVSEE